MKTPGAGYHTPGVVSFKEQISVVFMPIVIPSVARNSYSQQYILSRDVSTVRLRSGQASEGARFAISFFAQHEERATLDGDIKLLSKSIHNGLAQP